MIFYLDLRSLFSYWSWSDHFICSHSLSLSLSLHSQHWRRSFRATGVTHFCRNAVHVVSCLLMDEISASSVFLLYHMHCRAYSSSYSGTVIERVPQSRRGPRAQTDANIRKNCGNIEHAGYQLAKE